MGSIDEVTFPPHAQGKLGIFSSGFGLVAGL
jgi:hypothetical protein